MSLHRFLATKPRRIRQQTRLVFFLNVFTHCMYVVLSHYSFISVPFLCRKVYGYSVYRTNSSVDITVKKYLKSDITISVIAI